LKIRCVSLLTVLLLLAWPAQGEHTLTSQQHKVLARWLAGHPQFRSAEDRDCDCATDIERIREGSGGNWQAIPDYHPFAATGDFNGDGAEDFAVIVVDQSKRENPGTLLVFNGPFKSPVKSPAFLKSGLKLKLQALFYGPPMRIPHQLVLGCFECDARSVVVPHGRGYRIGD
jgi:hypothetical protein